jgi:hypothetical protein
MNLFDEKNSGRYGPYLEPSDTAMQYSEGQIDPRGDGWRRNVTEQLVRAKAQGFAYIGWDNADAYTSDDLLGYRNQPRLRPACRRQESGADR